MTPEAGRAIARQHRPNLIADRIRSCRTSHPLSPFAHAELNDRRLRACFFDLLRRSCMR
jgi:hypothetical protein